MTLLLAGCSVLGTGSPGAQPSAAGGGGEAATFATRYGQLPGAADPYVHLARELHHRGVGIWFETDLVSSWEQGAGAFEEDLRRLRILAQVPGVVGFKIADELGYHDGLTSVDQARRFLGDARRALQRIAPHAEVLVDVVVPELGCLAWHTQDGAVCAGRYRLEDPAASFAAVTGYLRDGLIDRLDVSTGLQRADTYRQWGLTRLEAQQEIWAHIRAAGWGRLTHLQARKALAEPGGYAGSAAEAADAMAVYVRTPTDYGAHAVDIWAWRQVTDDTPHSLLADDDQTNPLWDRLAAERHRGMTLFTHMRSSTMPLDPHRYAAECDLVAGVFSDVFVAAGTG